MRYGRSRLAWYDYILLGLAVAIVYPDKIVEWWCERTGRAFRWRHVMVLEAVAIPLMGIFMLWLKPMYPKLDWWYPAIGVGAIALFRAVIGAAKWCIARIFGFDD